jgi:hypothetical protein
MRKLAVALAALSLVVPVVVLAATDAAAEDTVPLGIGGSVTVQIGTPPSAPPPAAPPPVYAPTPAAAPRAYAPPPPPPPPPPPHHHESGANVHDGFYFRIGLGVGGFKAKGTFTPATVDGDATVSGGGLGLDFALGGTPFPGLVIGGELVFQQLLKPDVALAGGANGTASDNVNFGILGAFVDWYPNPRGGFHVGALVGAAGLTRSDPNTGETRASNNGAGVSLTAGYDFWISRQWSIGLGARLFGGSVSQTYADGSTEKNAVSGGTLSVSALWH